MKLRIGIMGTRGIPNRYGGFEQFAQSLSVELVKRGHEVTVYNSDLHPYKASSFEGVRIVHSRDWENKLGTAGQFIYDLNCIRDAARQNFDVLLHLGYTSDSIWWRRWPKAMVHLMNMDGMEWQRSKYNAVTRWFLKKAEALGARHADGLVADSPGIKDYLLATYKKEAAFIAYPAVLFEEPDATRIDAYNIKPQDYYLLIARMEPENNVEMIVQGYLSAKVKEPLVVVGNMTSRFGRYLLSKYNSSTILYTGAVYDQSVLNNLRYFSRCYFHGHSVGGTNPSLLEAMACNASIVAHDNRFNRAVLGTDADYFSTAGDVGQLITGTMDTSLQFQRKENNREKIRTEYSPDKITTAYETLMRELVFNAGRR